MGIVDYCCQQCGSFFKSNSANKRKFCSYECAYIGRIFVAPNPKTHGKSRTVIYKIWFNMHDRCRNPKNKGYKYYGARGIRVCDRWNKFENFYADMGDRPEPNLTIERVNNEMGYSPNNCKWATVAEQNKNKRNITGYWERDEYKSQI